MNNSLDTGIVTMSDDFFETMLNGSDSQQTTPPVVETAPVNTVEVNTAEQPVQQPLENTAINQLPDDFLDQVPDATDEVEDKNDDQPAGSTTTDGPTDLLRTMTDFFVEKGLWDDFEGREEFEFTNENFESLLVKQTERKAYEQFDNIVESTGEYGKAIISFIQEGGNPDEIIDLFKEQRSVTNVDLSTDESKKAYIEQYYTIVANMKPERAKRFVTDLEMEGELDKELADVKEHYENHYKVQREALAEEQQRETARRQQYEEDYRRNVMSEVSKRTDLTDGQRRKLAESILVQDQKLPDGTMVNKVYTAFNNIQNNLSDYLEFVEFVTDKENYKNKLKTEGQNKSAEIIWNGIKRNGSTSRKSGSSNTQTQQPTTSFKFF